MEQVDIAIYRATLLAKTKRKVAEAEGKGAPLEKSEVEAIVSEEWRRWEKLLSPKETTGEEYEKFEEKFESPDLLRKLVERR